MKLNTLLAFLVTIVSAHSSNLSAEPFPKRACYVTKRVINKKAEKQLECFVRIDEIAPETLFNVNQKEIHRATMDSNSSLDIERSSLRLLSRSILQKAYSNWKAESYMNIDFAGISDTPLLFIKFYDFKEKSGNSLTLDADIEILVSDTITDTRYTFKELRDSPGEFEVKGTDYSIKTIPFEEAEKDSKLLSSNFSTSNRLETYRKKVSSLYRGKAPVVLNVTFPLKSKSYTRIRKLYFEMRDPDDRIISATHILRSHMASKEGHTYRLILPNLSDKHTLVLKVPSKTSQKKIHIAETLPIIPHSPKHTSYIKRVEFSVSPGTSMNKKELQNVLKEPHATLKEVKTIAMKDKKLGLEGCRMVLTKNSDLLKELQLKENDILTNINGESCKDLKKQLVVALEKLLAGNVLFLNLYREAKEIKYKFYQSKDESEILLSVITEEASN